MKNFMNEYSKTYEIRWSGIDANGHVNYAAYIDAAGDLRYRFFTEYGFPPEKFTQLGIGPIYTAINAQFFQEVHMGETVIIDPRNVPGIIKSVIKRFVSHTEQLVMQVCVAKIEKNQRSRKSDLHRCFIILIASLWELTSALYLVVLQKVSFDRHV